MNTRIMERGSNGDGIVEVPITNALLGEPCTGAFMGIKKTFDPIT